MTKSIDIKEAYIQAGQGHLFKYWDELSEEEQSSFLDQLSKLSNPSKFLSDVSQAIQFSANNSASRKLSPLPASSYTSNLDVDSKTLHQWTEFGYEQLKQNKVGIILMAGGQGTRLGSSAPKGCYDVGLPSHKSLFQIQAERIVRLKQLTESKFGLASGSVTIPLYVMTSGPTRVATETFFSEHGYFGLDKSDVTFFNQGVLPAVSLDGKHLLLDSKNSIVESPDGNGGLYKALADNEIIEDFKKRGIEHIHMYCVDNILVKVGDPEFIVLV
ncbi:unnamed protein product [Ambrosiozyma monospora]|uniref:Unnamed protein product n=1 Tax=Ambrosiozyma monospora TaxID=43982 RepID=A0ACB5SZR7_AMBMO|nr:unnamed protein product [Ambrosiozyma monospora]